jgi:hypothetical protein
VFFHYFMSQRLEASVDFLGHVQSACSEAATSARPGEGG